MTVAPEAQAADAISIAALAVGYGNQVAAYWTCQARQAAEIATKRAGQSTILLVLIISSVLLAFGLGVYGILMTHKVAGPLFKVSLYLEKMKNGRLDKVYNLRKGDQLVEFYEHFKTGHAGMVSLQQGDIAALKAAQDTISASAGSVGDRLQSLIAKKEKSLE
jgi:nitrogen fixation/metabolism regulation signal transduction histidine kinase